MSLSRTRALVALTLFLASLVLAGPRFLTSANGANFLRRQLSDEPTGQLPTREEVIG